MSLVDLVESQAEFFSCDGCSAEVAARRKASFSAGRQAALEASLQDLSEKWKKKYPKCGILRTLVKLRHGSKLWIQGHEFSLDRRHSKRRGSFGLRSSRR